ncbi:MAG TPA: tetratricopeptide repeat protein [Pseudomonadales bacterium]|nr:tetratricopeptide repeat protein [Pseudomonadales bacterium]HNC69167.1 tetratricopeptide repeat protein [Pseudomonadales bacterium]
MDPYRTEEDQIRALKQWWEHNGSSTLFGLGLALAIVFGWQWWHQRQQSAGEQAAMLYQQLLQAVENSAEDEVQRTNARHLGGELLKIAAVSRLGDQTQLMLARIAVERDDFAEAQQHLEAVLDHNPDVVRGALATRVYGLFGRAPDPELGALARVRLARVQFAAGNADAALATLEAAGTDDFLWQRHELRGDILRQHGDRAAALQAYQAASAAADVRVPPLLQMKLRELELEPDAVQTAAPVATEAATTTETAPEDKGAQP